MSFFTELRPTGHPFLKKAPADVLMRQSRRSTCELSERQELQDSDEFIVTGSEGDDYTVVIGGDSKQRVSCSCPDKIVPCKHLAFVYLDVLKLAKTNALVWQPAFTPKEILQLLPRLSPSNDKSTNEKKRAASKDPEEASATETTSKKARSEGTTKVYASDVEEAIEAMHLLDALKPSKQFENSPKVTSAVSRILTSIRESATDATSTLATRSNAILALITISEHFSDCPREISRALVGCGGGCAEEVVEAVGEILDGCEGKLEAKVLEKIEGLEGNEDWEGIWEDAEMEEKLERYKEKVN